MSVVSFLGKEQKVKELELTALCEKRLQERTGLQVLAEESVWDVKA
jgi:hypothetical protein